MKKSEDEDKQKNEDALDYERIAKDLNKEIFEYVMDKSEIKRAASILREHQQKEQPIIAPAQYRDGIINLAGKKIDFNKKTIQKEMLDIIFAPQFKNIWLYYDQMLDEWDELKNLNAIKLPKNYWKKFDTAAININRTIAIETGIRDFLLKDSKKIRINPGYI